MKYALVFLGVLVYCSFQEADAAIRCDEQFKGTATDKFITTLCPLFQATPYDIEDIVECKEKKGERVRYAVKQCAKEYNSTEYDSITIARRIICGEEQLAKQWTCCYMSYASEASGNMDAKELTKICADCIQDPKSADDDR